MSDFLGNLTKSNLFILCTGIASLVSLIVSMLNDNFILWAIFTFCLVNSILIFMLVGKNQKMFKRLDDLNCNIFNSNIELEFDEDKNYYYSSSPIIIVFTSFLTTETLNNDPFVTVQVDYPSELDIEFNIMSETILREEANSNSAKFKVTLKAEAIVLIIDNIRLLKDKEDEFLRTTKKINFKFESKLLLENKSESLLVSI